MAAVVEASIYTGAGPTRASAESGGVTFGTSDAVLSTSPVVKPVTADSTNYSWYKVFGLHVSSGGGTTDISNRDIYLGSALATGLYLFFDAAATYTQAAGGNKPADSTASDGAVPTDYTLLTESPQLYDAASEAATNSARNGDYVQVVAGVGTSFAGGAGDASLPNILLDYDES